MLDTFSQTVGGRYNPMINNHCQYVFWRSTSQIFIFLVSSFLVYTKESVIHLNGNFREMFYFNFLLGSDFYYSIL